MKVLVAKESTCGHLTCQGFVCKIVRDLCTATPPSCAASTLPRPWTSASTRSSRGRRSTGCRRRRGCRFARRSTRIAGPLMRVRTAHRARPRFSWRTVATSRCASCASVTRSTAPSDPATHLPPGSRRALRAALRPRRLRAAGPAQPPCGARASSRTRIRPRLASCVPTRRSASRSVQQGRRVRGLPARCGQSAGSRCRRARTTGPCALADQGSGPR